MGLCRSNREFESRGVVHLACLNGSVLTSRAKMEREKQCLRKGNATFCAHVDFFVLFLRRRSVRLTVTGIFPRKRGATCLSLSP